MIIKSIQLENFKSHLNTNLDFDTGISIIMGDNGAGKSSILESISFALFKEYSGKKMDRLINNDRDHLKVALEFMANGRTYKVIRKRKRNSSPESMLYIEDDDKFSVIEKGDAAVTSAIEKIIDLDKNLFLNAVYVRQGEIASLITKNPAEKKEMMGRLLGVEELENSWKQMKFVIEEYNNKLIHINGKLANLETVEDEKRLKENNRDELKNELSNKNGLLIQKKEKLQKLRDINEYLGQQENEFNRLDHDIDHYKTSFQRFQDIKKDLSQKIEEIDKKIEEIKKIEPEISKIDVLEDLKEKTTDLKEIESQSEIIERDIQKISNFKKLLSDNEKSYNAYINLELQIDDLLKLRKDYEGSYSLKETYEDNIKQLTIDVEDLKNNISIQFLDYGNIIGEKIDSIEELESKLEFKKIDLEKEQNQNNNTREKFTSLISDLYGQNKEIKKASFELESADDKCPVCESDLEEYRKEELLNKYQLQIKENKEKINSYDKELIDFNTRFKKLEHEKKNLDKINIDFLKRESLDLSNKQKDAERINEKLKEINESVDKLKQIDSQIEELNDNKDALKDGHHKYLGAQNFLKSTEDPGKLSEKLDIIQGKMNSLKSIIDTICAENNILKHEVNDELQNLRLIKQKYDVLSGEVKDRDNVLKRLKETDDEILKTSIKLDSLNEKMSLINYDVDKHQKAKDDLSQCQSEYEALQRDVGLINGQLNETDKRLVEISNEIESFRNDKKEQEKIGRFINLLNNIRSLYGKDGLQKDLRNRSRPLIESNTLGFFNKFNFEYSDIKLDENYDVTLFGPSGENTMDMMSGGEIIAAAIALRLGIAKSLLKGNLELMILDEPTVHLDSYRRHELIDVIKRLSVIPQMIIVTHDEGLEEAAGNILRIKKENGVSKLADIS